MEVGAFKSITAERAEVAEIAERPAGLFANPGSHCFFCVLRILCALCGKLFFRHPPGE